MNLKGKTVVVTGGLGALGRVVVDTLRGEGAGVAVIDFAPAAVGAQAVWGGVDLADDSQASAAMIGAAKTLGPLDGLVNVAGGFQWQTLAEGALETWDRMYRVNLRSAVSACRAALPHFKNQGGAIVNVGALAAQQAGAGLGAYAAAKAGVARLTESLAQELKGRHITVNAVLPSIIDTPANRAQMPAADVSQWVSPESLARVIAYLLSDNARGVTGALIPVTAPG